MISTYRIQSKHPYILVASLSFFLSSMVFYLHAQGRLWIASSGIMKIWVGDTFSPDNSQQLLDPYSFSHFLHGVIFFFVLNLFFKKFSIQSRLVAAVMLEGCWEMLENSAMVINRYREATAALGYSGDTIYNSFGDILSCSIGFIVVRYIGWKWSLALFFAIELFCLFWIKDNLTLNVLMLIYPVEGIKEWQLGV